MDFFSFTLLCRRRGGILLPPGGCHTSTLECFAWFARCIAGRQPRRSVKKDSRTQRGVGRHQWDCFVSRAIGRSYASRPRPFHYANPHARHERHWQIATAAAGFRLRLGERALHSDSTCLLAEPQTEIGLNSIYPGKFNRRLL